MSIRGTRKDVYEGREDLRSRSWIQGSQFKHMASMRCCSDLMLFRSSSSIRNFDEQPLSEEVDDYDSSDGDDGDGDAGGSEDGVD